MLSFAEHQFKLAKPNEDGKSMREHLEQVEKQLGREIEELNGPRLPDILSSLWTYFLSINQGRSAGFSGPNSLSYTDIKAWCELTGTPLDAREVQTIKLLDSVYIRIMTSDG